MLERPTHLLSSATENDNIVPIKGRKIVTQMFSIKLHVANSTSCCSCMMTKKPVTCRKVKVHGEGACTLFLFIFWQQTIQCDRNRTLPLALKFSFPHH